MSRVVVFLALLAACGGGSAGKADLAVSSPSDAAFAAADLSQSLPQDLAPVTGIACGTTPCAANAQFCCTSTRGTTGMCGFGSDASNCKGSLFYCDGPEDCPPAEPVCCFSTPAAICQASACPGTTSGGLTLCHADKECNSGQVCCGSSTSPYKLCLNPGCIAP